MASEKVAAQRNNVFLSLCFASDIAINPFNNMHEGAVYRLKLYIKTLAKTEKTKKENN